LVANTGDDSLTLVSLTDPCDIKTIFLSKLIEDEEDSSTQENNQLGPFDVILSEEGWIYIANSYDNSIMKIDLENVKLLGFIKVGRNPTCIKCFKGKIYVVNSDSNSISIIDEKTFSLIEDISMGERPTDIKIDEDSLKAFVANGNCYTINVLDLVTEKITSITLSKQPIKIEIEGKRLFVLSYINNGITNYSNLSEMELNDYKTVMSVDLKGIFSNFIKIKGKDIFYLSNVEDGYIYKIAVDDEINISKIYLGKMPSNITWDGKEKLYIADILNDVLTIINEPDSQIINKIRVGHEPNGILLL
jgi:YVTN family beta-propeller protein